MSRPKFAAATLVVAATTFGSTAGEAEDFFSQLFGGFSRRAERSIDRLPFVAEFQDGGATARSDNDSPRRRSGGSQAFCVRTCDGRYFPIATGDNQSKASACSNFCPASETKVYYGSSIDRAANEDGRRYGDLSNAFKYRTELVSGCTCNGKATGLASVKIEDDPSVRSGDIVAGADGLLVSRRSDRRGALNLSPASPSVRSGYERMPVAEAE